MARQPDVQYIRFYTDGSAARVLAPKAERKKETALPKPCKQQKLVIRLDPLACAGILVSAVMLVLMAVGCFRFVVAQQEMVQMYNYVESLAEDNRRLTDEYESGYDLEDVHRAAKALGMIPIEQAQSISISVPAEQVEEQPGGWNTFWTFLTGLFA